MRRAAIGPRPRPAQRLHPGWILAALAAYVGCAAFFIGADPWDPLSASGGGILLVSSVAVGLVGGRWWMPAAALSLVALAPLTRTPQPLLFFALAVPFFVVVCAVLIALAVGLRAYVRRRSPEAERRVAFAGLGLLALVVALTGFGIYLDHRAVDRAPARPLLVDERTGAFRGIAPGMPAARARQLLGEPAPDQEAFAPTPLGADPGDVSGPSSLPAWQTWRYRRLVVFTSDGRVRGYLTTDPSAQTAPGAGVGDSLEVVKGHYSHLDCYGVTLGGDAVNPSYLACQGPIASGDQIFFGGDPVDSIWVSARDSDF